MRPDLGCPDGPTLERLLLGRVSDEEAEPLEQHLATCVRCAALLDRLPAEDAFTDALRGRSPILTDPECAVADRLIKPLQGLRVTADEAAPPTLVLRPSSATLISAAGDGGVGPPPLSRGFDGEGPGRGKGGFGGLSTGGEGVGFGGRGGTGAGWLTAT